MIISELGKGASIPAPVQPEPTSLTEATVDKECEGEVAESASAKKKKRKKEKKAAAGTRAVAASTAEVMEEEINGETDTKLADKKIPKHVREMQKALAKRKEAEERKEREEEERLRKEEEECHRQEELKREAEEMGKEKRLKKKQEGKLLTRKQKEEQLRRVALRNVLLAGKMVTLTSPDNGILTKRPIYTEIKPKTWTSKWC